MEIAYTYLREKDFNQAICCQEKCLNILENLQTGWVQHSNTLAECYVDLGYS